MASSSWASYSGYTYQRTVTISNTMVSTQAATESNFPVLISSNVPSISTNATYGHMTSAYDQVFSTMSDCSYLLHWDTETVNNTGSSSTVVWVNVPTISSITSTTIYWCYGNSSITTYRGVSTATWDSNYQGVWHLSNGTTLGDGTYVYDSTSNGNKGTINNATATTGQIDGGAAFPGGTGTSNINVGTALNPASSGRTYEVWVNATSWNTVPYSSLIYKYENGVNSQIMVNGIGKLSIYLSATGGLVDYDENGTYSMTKQVWHFAVMTYDSTNGLSGYIDGNLDHNVAANGTAKADTGATMLGSHLNDNTRNLVGSLDEARISNTARSADWIQTEYNNQSSPSSYITVGSETTSGATGSAFFFGGL